LTGQAREDVGRAPGAAATTKRIGRVGKSAPKRRARGQKRGNGAAVAGIDDAKISLRSPLVPGLRDAHFSSRRRYAEAAIEDFATGCSWNMVKVQGPEGSGRPMVSSEQETGMFAIVYKSDGVPICVQVPGVSPDPSVVWSSESAASVYRQQGRRRRVQAVSVNEQAMEKNGQGTRCPSKNSC